MPNAPFAALAQVAKAIDGYEQTLSSVANAGQFKMEMDVTDSVVKMTVDGGAWISLFAAPGPVITMQETYDGGGAVGTGLGRSGTTMNGWPANARAIALWLAASSS